MDVAAFVRNLGPTAFLAFAGTAFSTFVVGGLVYAGGQLGLCYPLGLLASITFGSIISATECGVRYSTLQPCGSLGSI